MSDFDANRTTRIFQADIERRIRQLRREQLWNNVKLFLIVAGVVAVPFIMILCALLSRD